MYKITTLLVVLILCATQIFSQTQTINGNFSFAGTNTTESSTVITACGEEVEITVTTTNNHTISIQDDDWLRYVPDPNTLVTDVTVTFNPAVDNPRLVLGDFDFQPNTYFEVISNIGSVPNPDDITISQYESEPMVEIDEYLNVFYDSNTTSETSSWVNWLGDNISSLSFTTTFPASSWGMQLREYEFECICKEVVIIESQSICTESPALETIPISVIDGGAGGTWSSSDGFIEDPTATNTTITGVGDFGIVNVYWMDNCTGQIYETSIDFLESPDAELEVLPNSILCEDETGTVFVTPQVDGSIYSWNLLCDNEVEEVSNNPEFEIPEDHIGLVCLNITYPNGCTDQAKTVIKRMDCSCEDGLYPGMPDQVVCTADFTFCMDVPNGFFLTSATLDNNELIITDNTELCVSVAGVYILELEHLASGCTVDDLVVITEDTTCCTIMPDFSSANAFGFCSFYQFTNISSGSPTTDILGYNWNFGNGQFSALENPTSVFYENEGVYDVTLTVTGIDDQGNCCSESTTQQIDVNCPCSNQADFSSSIDDCIVALTDASTAGFGSTNYNWQWDMGDGTLLFGQNVEHTYATNGTYDIELTTSAYDDNEICQSSSIQTIVVNCGATIPCDVTPDFNLQLVTSWLILSDNSTVGNGTTIQGHNWSIDGVDVGTGSVLTIAALPPGSYNVCMELIAVSDGDCCVTSVCEIYNFANVIQKDDSEIESSNRNVRQNGMSELHLYPNPSNGNTKVSVLGMKDAEDMMVEVFSSDGKKAIQPFTTSEFNFDVDVSQLSPGIYLIKVQSGKEVLIERLVVE